jgi:hypothetical protein
MVPDNTAWQLLAMILTLAFMAIVGAILASSEFRNLCFREMHDGQGRAAFGKLHITVIGGFALSLIFVCVAGAMLSLYRSELSSHRCLGELTIHRLKIGDCNGVAVVEMSDSSDRANVTVRTKGGSITIGGTSIGVPIVNVEQSNLDPKTSKYPRWQITPTTSESNPR